MKIFEENEIYFQPRDLSRISKSANKTIIGYCKEGLLKSMIFCKRYYVKPSDFKDFLLQYCTVDKEKSALYNEDLTLNSEFYTLLEVSHILLCSTTTLGKYIREKDLIAFKLGHRTERIYKGDLEAFRNKIKKYISSNSKKYLSSESK